QAGRIVRRTYTENLSHGLALRYGLLHKAGNLPPAQSWRIVSHFDLLALGILESQPMIHQLDHVAVRIVNVGVVFAAVFPLSRARVVAANRAPHASSSGARIGHTEGIEMRQGGLPVVHFHRKVHRRDTDGLRSLGKVHLPRADAQLELAPVERRTTVQELSTEHFLVPLPRPLPIANLDIDMMNQFYLRHGLPSSRRSRKELH